MIYHKPIKLQELLEIAKEAAISAGKEILKVYDAKDFGVELKKDDSPLTLADKASHEIITGFLSKTKLPILSEEGAKIPFEERKNWNLFWLIDPLDGTKEFIKRNGEFTVNIALIAKNKPIAGVVYVPVTRTLYWGSASGAFKKLLDTNSTEKLPLKSKENKFVVVASKSHMSNETETFIQAVNTKGKQLELISRGSSLKLCMVAEGLAQVYPRLAPTMEWDTAAAHAVVEAAGKRVIQYENNLPLAYNKENLLNPYFIVK